MNNRNLSAHERFVAKLQSPVRRYARKMQEQQKQTKNVHCAYGDNKELTELLEEYFDNPLDSFDDD